MNLAPPLPTLALAAALLVAFTAPARAADPANPIRPGDPWKAAQVIEPASLAAVLKATTGEKPMLLHVGFQRLYRGGAIPGSRYLGPGSTPEGIALLKREMKRVPRNRAIVLYCGCCPWDHCPNMAPAFRALAGMGFKNLRALHVTHGLGDDWADAGYPLEVPSRKAD